MRFPWTRSTENYQDSSYTDGLVAALIRQVRGSTSKTLVSESGALESASGLVGRSFAAAGVTGDAMYTRALNPSIMELIGRAVVRRGEIVLYLDTSHDGLSLIPVSTHSVDGNFHPSSWSYDLSLPGPGQLTSVAPVQADGVLHFRMNCDPETPWRGRSPLTVARAVADLLSSVSNYLIEESNAPRGQFLATPVDGADETISELKADIKTAAGAVLMVESMTNDFDQGGRSAGEWKTQHFGPSLGAGTVETARMARSEALGALGLNESLFSAADSAALRESWRLALFSVIAPMGEIVQSELRAKLDPSVTLSWTELRASDLAGRARAFQSLVNGGMALDEATQVAGIMVTE